MLKYLIKLFLKHFTVVSVSFWNQKSLIPHLQHLQGMHNMSLFAVHMQLWDELSWAHSHYEKEAADTAAHKFFSSVAVAVAVAVSADANVAVAALLLWNRLENVFVNTTVIWLDYLGFDCDEHMTWRMQMPSAGGAGGRGNEDRDRERDRENGREGDACWWRCGRLHEIGDSQITTNVGQSITGGAAAAAAEDEEAATADAAAAETATEAAAAATAVTEEEEAAIEAAESAETLGLHWEKLRQITRWGKIH